MGISYIYNMFSIKYGNNRFLESIHIKYPIRELPAEAFFGSSYYTDYLNLDSTNDLNLPSTITKYGDFAFQGSNFKKAYIPANVVELEGMGHFYTCASLTEMIFDSKSKIKVIPKVIPKIFCCACNELTNVVLPNTLEEIGDSAFSSCQKLKNITLPNTIKKLGQAIFSYAPLESLTLPSSLIDIDSQALKDLTMHISNFTNNTSFDAEENNYWSGNIYTDIIDNVYYRNNILINIKNGLGITEINVDTNVTDIKCDPIYNLTTVNYAGSPSGWTSINKPDTWDTINVICAIEDEPIPEPEKDYITFADPKVETLLLSFGIGDGVGITREDMSNKHRFTKDEIDTMRVSDIEYFEEFEYFDQLYGYPSQTNPFSYSTTSLLQNTTKLKCVKLPTFHNDPIPGDVITEGPDRIFQNINKKDYSEYDVLSINFDNLVPAEWYDDIVNGDNTHKVAIPTISGFMCEKRPINQFVLPEGIQKIERSVCYQSYCVKTIDLPSTITQIGEQAFTNACQNDPFGTGCVIICRALTPPSIDNNVNNVFANIVTVKTGNDWKLGYRNGHGQSQIPILVPQSAISAYESTWGELMSGMTFLPIETTEGGKYMYKK